MITKFEQFIKESVSEDAMFKYYDIVDEESNDLFNEMMTHEKGERQKWEVIRAPRLIKIWNDYVTLGFVRDEKGLDDIADRLVRNVAKLELNTQMMGHTSHGWLYDEWKDMYELSDEDYEKIKEIVDSADDPFFDDENGSWRLSDYGLGPLQNLAGQILDAETPEEKLILIDQALNVCHQRSDLASWFIEGGTSTLNKLFGEEEIYNNFSKT